MGQKAHPKGLRLGHDIEPNKGWLSRWFSNADFAKNLNDDLNIRKFITKKYLDAAIVRVEIERAAKQLVVKIFAAKPGKLIGKLGKGIDTLRDEVKQVIQQKDKNVKVDVVEVKNADSYATLVAQSIAQQLEKRISFRRAMKAAMQRVMKSSGCEGVKVRVSGRLNGAEMARTEWYKEGRIPLHTLRANIDYATAEASTTYGIIGVKVWIFKGEVFASRSSSVGIAANPATHSVPSPE